MKLVRYRADGNDARLGLLCNGGKSVGDLAAAYDRKTGSGSGARLFPDDVAGWLRSGEEGRAALAEAADYLAAGDAGDLISALDTVSQEAPIRPPKMIAVGRNYSEHMAEMRGHEITEGPTVPSAWIKANSCICGPNDNIVKPHMTKMLDYETELSLVIGTRCKDVQEDRAYEVIAGYTIVNDISARDVARIERKEGNQLLGKMFDTFAPMGPCFVPADEIADPMDMPLRTRVNGESRQNSTTGNMIWNIPQLISYLSQMTLDIGDVILTGTPSGVASGHKVEGENWFLQDGDILESELEGIGTMRNRIVDDSERPRSWQWKNG